MKPGPVNSSLSIHVVNELVAVKAAVDVKMRPLLLIMSLVIAKTQELTSSFFLCNRSIIALIQQSGWDDAVAVFLLIAWNGKALSSPAYLRIDINISPQRRGDAEEKQLVRYGLVGWALPTVIIMVGKAHPTC